MQDAKTKCDMGRGAKSALQSATSLAFLSIIHGPHHSFCLSGANPAVTQSASFAFGAGGFVEDTSNEVGLFNECKAQLDANGKAVCDAYTTLVDGQGETVNIAQTMLSSEYGDLQASSNSGAVAAFDLSGFGSTATRCALSQSNGFSHCHSGASASSDGAFAATKLGSMR